MTYHVVDWDRHYESAATRKLKSLSSFLCPNSYDSDGYIELVEDHPDGMAHYAVWIVVLGLASKGLTRGVLTKGRNGAGHDAKSIARIARFDVEVVATAIQRLVDIGWLAGETQSATTPGESATAMAEEPDEVAGLSGDIVGPTHPNKEKKGKGIEEKEREDGTSSSPAGAGPSSSEICSTWNSWAERFGLKRITKLSPKRRKQWLARQRAVPDLVEAIPRQMPRRSSWHVERQIPEYDQLFRSDDALLGFLEGGASLCGQREERDGAGAGAAAKSEMQRLFEEANRKGAAS